MGLFSKNKMKYCIICLREHNDNLFFVKKKNLSTIPDKDVNIGKGRSVCLNFTNPSYISNNTFYYFVEIMSGNQYSFKETESIFNTALLDDLVNEKLTRTILRSVGSSVNGIDWQSFGMGALLSLAIASIVFFVIYNNKVSELMEIIKDFYEIPIFP